MTSLIPSAFRTGIAPERIPDRDERLDGRFRRHRFSDQANLLPKARSFSFF